MKIPISLFVLVFFTHFKLFSNHYTLINGFDTQLLLEECTTTGTTDSSIRLLAQIVLLHPTYGQPFELLPCSHKVLAPPCISTCHAFSMCHQAHHGLRLELCHGLLSWPPFVEPPIPKGLNLNGLRGSTWK